MSSNIQGRLPQKERIQADRETLTGLLLLKKSMGEQ